MWTAAKKAGLAVMDRGKKGWCIALDLKSMRCGIYDSRPDTCRRFTMESGYCRDVRERYAVSNKVDAALLPGE